MEFWYQRMAKNKSLNKWVTPTQGTFLIPAGKVRCYITDELRKDTPEEHVRQKVARILVEEYGYEKKDTELNFPISVFSPN